jgi:hypothetical protein
MSRNEKDEGDPEPDGCDGEEGDRHETVEMSLKEGPPGWRWRPSAGTRYLPTLVPRCRCPA